MLEHPLLAQIVHEVCLINCGAPLLFRILLLANRQASAAIIILFTVSVSTIYSLVS